MSAPTSPIELLPHVQLALESVKDIPPEQQQAVLEAAAAAARATVELRSRLYMQGSLIASLGRK